MQEFQGCPGSRMMSFKNIETRETDAATGKIQSRLRQWPIQLHLVPPTAPYFRDADVLLAADCVAYALGDFHRDYLSGKALAIACPKLDSGQEIYIEKIKTWIDEAEIRSLSVLIMQVPCCMGLLKMARGALEGSRRKIPLHHTVVGVQGDILEQAQDPAVSAAPNTIPCAGGR